MGRSSTALRRLLDFNCVGSAIPPAAVAICAMIVAAPLRAQDTAHDTSLTSQPPQASSDVSPGSSIGAAEQRGAEGPGQEIVVTGSRLGRSTFTTPNPVTVLGEQQIQQLGLVNVGDVIAELPQNSNFFSNNNVGLGNFNVGAQLANLRGLNPFFGTRTLTLVDSRRVVPNTTGGAVDITLIPSVLVGRTETVTGGASAVYGSDAVAGVVNIILDTKLQGFKAVGDYGATTHGDGGDVHGGLAWGSDFADHRGHIIIGGEVERQSAIGICAQRRDWCAREEALFTNPDYNMPGTAGYGQPYITVGPNAKLANQSQTGVLAPCFVYEGVCVRGPNQQLNFNTAGSAVSPFNPGSYSAGAGFFGFRQGGDGDDIGAYDATTLRPLVKRYTGLAHVDFDVTDHIKTFVEGAFGRTDAVNPVANGAIGPYSLEVANGVYVGSHIAPDNAFLPADVAAAIGPNGAEFGRNMQNILHASNTTRNTVWRVTGGLSGDFSSKWSWDIYGTYGKDTNSQRLFNSVVNGGGQGYDFLNWALDAVRDGSGNIVCGATIAGRINPETGVAYTATDRSRAISTGCTPLNLFGANNASQQALAYAFRTLEENYTYQQEVVSGNIHGELFSGFGAGPVKLALGGEYRREHGNVTHDLANQPYYDQYALSYGLDYRGTIESTEGYGEINIPVLKSLPAIQYLEFDGAIRGIHNRNTDDTPILDQGATNPDYHASRTNNIVAWKASGIWDVTSWFRVRATRSRDVRAPGFRELYQTYAAGSGPFGSVNNPFNNGFSDAANIHTGGNIDLKPERADTTTAGVVLTPKGALSGLRFSADWYQIKLHDPIAGPPNGIGAQNIVAECYQGVQAFCDLITFADPSRKDITAIQNTAANLGSFITRGVDFEGDYNLPLRTLRSSWDGSLNLRVIASYLYDMIIDNGLGGPALNYAGQTGPTGAFGGFNTEPHWQGNAFLTYAGGPFTGTVQLRYVGSGKFLTVDPTTLAPVSQSLPSTALGSIVSNRVKAAAYINLASTYSITKNIQLFGTINNLFDKDPVVAPGGNGYPTNPVYFDTLGRTFKVGARLKF